MKRLMVSLVAVVLFVACSMSSVALDREYMKGFALGRAIELCELVVVGRIISVEGVWREKLDSKITTDITVEVEKIVLGTPNAMPGKVKFMVKGGRVRNPHTGTMQGLIATNIPYSKFKVGQRALWFLYVGESEELYADYPHGKHQLLHGLYGRRLIKDDRIQMYYLPSESNQFKVVELPLGLATGLGKAFVENKGAAAELEALIKSRVNRAGYRKVRLPDSTVGDLTTKAKRIVDAAKAKLQPMPR